MTRLEDWIDFIEGEADEKTRGRLSLLLAHSKTDRLIYKNLRRLRQIVLHADKAEAIEPLLENEKLMMDLHNRIMKTVTSKPASSIRRKGRGFSQNSCKPE